MRNHSPSSWHSVMYNRSFSLTAFKIILHLCFFIRLCVRVRLSELRSVSLNQWCFQPFFSSYIFFCTFPSDPPTAQKVELAILFHISLRLNFCSFFLFVFQIVPFLLIHYFSESFLCLLCSVIQPIQWMFAFGYCMLSSKISICFFFIVFTSLWRTSFQ